MQHTEGNWSVIKSNEGVYELTTDLRVVSDSRTICSFNHLSEKYSKDFPREEVEANAALIAVAPELLEMVECFRLSAEKGFKGSDAKYWAKQCLKLIAKATAKIL